MEPTPSTNTLLRDVNCHLICSVCRGYLIDATTITECLHSFCRSCIVPHVAEFHNCPKCSVPLSSTKPFSELRRDYTLQSIVYKMVPRLARKELDRRHRIKSGDVDERYLQSFYSPEDPISISLEYADPNCMFGMRQKLIDDESVSYCENKKRYFQCPAALPLDLLVKFLRAKFNVIDPSVHKMEILYNGHPLSPEYKLADVAYIFSWKEREPLRLWYRITPSVTDKTDEVVKVDKRASLVDITSKRNLEMGGRLERRKRRKSKQSHLVDSLIIPYNKKTKNIIFDEKPEFSCSTPIPAESGEPSKIQNWLPKAVFDLDDRDLFAKRLQRIIRPAPDDIKKEPLSPPLNPLRICVDPPEVHDSVGALDLSGNKADSSGELPSPAGSAPSPGAGSKSGPHPYFMTPSAVLHHVQQQDPAQSMASALASVSSRKSPASDSGCDPASTKPKRSPSWDIFSYVKPSASAGADQVSAHQSLLTLFKTNTLCFRKHPSEPPNSV